MGPLGDSLWRVLAEFHIPGCGFRASHPCMPGPGLRLRRQKNLLGRFYLSLLALFYLLRCYRVPESFFARSSVSFFFPLPCTEIDSWPSVNCCR